MACCIYRIDDVNPQMNWNNFEKFMDLFRRYDVVPLVGIVPDNRDPKLKVAPEKESYWEILKNLKDKRRIEIAQHGYQHKYTTKKIHGFYRFCGFTPQSEFAGIPYDEQYDMIRSGREILAGHGLATDVWMAPGHSFDGNTVRALKALKFRAITDGIGLYPTRNDGILRVPQTSWRPGKSVLGVKTVCMHLDHATDRLYQQVEEHLGTDPRVVPFSAVLDHAGSIRHHFMNFVYKGIFVLNLLGK